MGEKSVFVFLEVLEKLLLGVIRKKERHHRIEKQKLDAESMTLREPERLDDQIN